MIGRITTLLLCLALTACTTVAPSVPENYTGPRATVNDSIRPHDGSKADVFVVEQLDGKDIDNAMRRSYQASQGRGFALTTVPFGRPVPAGQTLRMGLRARTIYAAPIQALTGTVYQVKGVVEFVPEANATYVVRGEFGEQYSAVWLEDAATRAVVGSKIEVKGSAKLGVLEK